MAVLRDRCGYLIRGLQCSGVDCNQLKVTLISFLGKDLSLQSYCIKMIFSPMMSFFHYNKQRIRIITILLILLGLCLLRTVRRELHRLEQIKNISFHGIYDLTASYLDKPHCRSLSVHLNSSEPKLLVNNQYFLRYFAERDKIPGWASIETLYVVWLLVQFQYRQLQKVNGAIGEIGVHRGKLTSYMYLLRHRNQQQKLFAVDIFSKKALNIDASGNGDREEFLNNVKHYANVASDEIILYEGSSLELNSALINNRKGEHWWQKKLGKRSCQLVSIDGGHTNLLTYSDLCLISNSLADGGIVLVDDIDHPCWLGVRDGVGQFLSETSVIFNGNDDPELSSAMNEKFTTPDFNLSCRIVDATRKITNLNHRCSRLVPILHYSRKLYLTTPNYYPHYIDLLKKLNDKGTNFVRYDTLQSTIGNVPVWSDTETKNYSIFNEIVRPQWMAELVQATE